MMRGNAVARACLSPGSPTRLRHIFFRGTCLSNTCFMFVLLTLTIPRLFYFAGYEILCWVRNSDRRTKLLGTFLLGRGDSHFGLSRRPLKTSNWQALRRQQKSHRMIMLLRLMTHDQ